MSAEFEITFDASVGRDHVIIDPDDPTTEYSTTAIAGKAKKTIITSKGVTTEEIPLMYEPGRERVSASRISPDGTTVTGAAHYRVMSSVIDVERFTQGMDGTVDRGATRGMSFDYSRRESGAAGSLDELRVQLAKVAVTALETQPGRRDAAFRKSLVRAVRPLGIPLRQRN